MLSIEPDGGTIVRLRGEVDLSTADALYAAVAPYAETDSFSLDLSGVTFLDSQGIRALLLVSRLREGRPVRLVSPTRAVMRVFEICGLASAPQFIIDSAA